MADGPRPKRGDLVRQLGNALRAANETSDGSSLSRRAKSSPRRSEVQEMIDICDLQLVFPGSSTG